MSIVTRTGDKGETGLFGGQRVGKDDLRIHAYGTVDELNAVLGLAIAGGDLSEVLQTQLLRTQNVLFRFGADLATPRENNAAKVPRIEQKHIDEIDAWITALEDRLPTLRAFVLPGGSVGASHLHNARTICRRAERWTVSLGKQQDIGQECIVYLNRLSDYLFLAALQANKDIGVEDVAVNYGD